MPLIQIILILIVVGVLLYCINTYGTKIDGKIKTLINWFVVAVVVLWLLKLTGILSYLSAIRVGN